MERPFNISEDNGDANYGSFDDGYLSSLQYIDPRDIRVIPIVEISEKLNFKIENNEKHMSVFGVYDTEDDCYYITNNGNVPDVLSYFSKNNPRLVILNKA